MSSATELSALQSLSEIVEALGPISGSTFDKWSGKRCQVRRPAALPVRLSLLGELENACGPAFPARCRDISTGGLGVTTACHIEAGRRLEVEVATDMGTWMGRMYLVHCTQTVGGYKVGLTTRPCREGRATDSAASLEDPEDGAEPHVLTLEQAQAQARQALRQYQLAESTWGMFGVRMEREIQRILATLPAPPAARMKLEPRRDDYRHDVGSSVYLLVPTGASHRLIRTRMADLSAGGARVRIAPGWTEAAWASGERVAIGMWTAKGTTLWLPARVVHHSSPLFRERTIGLQFMRSVSAPVKRL